MTGNTTGTSEENCNDRFNSVSRTKVRVVTQDGQVLWGRVFLQETQRLQDVANDDRRFFPLEVEVREGRAGTETAMVVRMIHKDFVCSIEELSEGPREV